MLLYLPNQDLVRLLVVHVVMQCLRNYHEKFKNTKGLESETSPIILYYNCQSMFLIPFPIFLYWNNLSYIIIITINNKFTGLRIHFCLLLPSSHALLRSLKSYGRTNVWGTKPYSCKCSDKKYFVSHLNENVTYWQTRQLSVAS